MSIDYLHKGDSEVGPEMPKPKKHDSKMYEKWYGRPYESRGKKDAQK